MRIRRLSLGNPGDVKPVGSGVSEIFCARFPAALLRPGAFIHVLLVTRDPKTNEPRTRARAIFYSDIEGGRA